MKNFFLTSAAALVLSIGAGWYYTASKFHHHSLAFLEYAKQHGIEFDAEINSAAFRAHLSNIRYKSPEHSLTITIPHTKLTYNIFNNTTEMYDLADTQIDILGKKIVLKDEGNLKIHHGSRNFSHMPENKFDIFGPGKLISRISSNSKNGHIKYENETITRSEKGQIELFSQTSKTPPNVDYLLKLNGKESTLGPGLLKLIEDIDLPSFSEKEKQAIKQMLPNLQNTVSSSSDYQINLTCEPEKVIEWLENSDSLISLVPKFTLKVNVSGVNQFAEGGGEFFINHHDQWDVNVNYTTSATEQLRSHYAKVFKAVAGSYPEMSPLPSNIEELLPDFKALSPLKLVLKGGFSSQILKLEQLNLSGSSFDLGLKGHYDLSKAGFACGLRIKNAKETIQAIADFVAKVADAHTSKEEDKAAKRMIIGTATFSILEFIKNHSITEGEYTVFNILYYPSEGKILLNDKPLPPELANIPAP